MLVKWDADSILGQGIWGAKDAQVSKAVDFLFYGSRKEVFHVGENSSSSDAAVASRYNHR